MDCGRIEATSGGRKVEVKKNPNSPRKFLVKYDEKPQKKMAVCHIIKIQRYVWDEILPNYICGDYFINHYFRILIKQPV